LKALRFTRERSTVRTLLKRLFALFWITFVILVVAGAIALTSVRVILANAEGYREEVVGWIGRQLQQPVTVSGLDARMQGLQPTLLLENVRLLDSRGEPTSLQFRELRVGIDLWKSLLRQRVTLGLLTVVGAEISVRRDRQGKLQVEGLALKLDRPVNTAAPADTGGAGEWLLSQSRLLIRDSIIRWQDEGRDEPPLRTRAGVISWMAWSCCRRGWGGPSAWRQTFPAAAVRFTIGAEASISTGWEYDWDRCWRCSGRNGLPVVSATVVSANWIWSCGGGGKEAV